MNGASERSRWPWAVATALLLVFAFLYTFPCGLRGFQPFDTNIFFDGGYRILHGQVPFRDFFAPIGPVLFYLQAAFFRLFGVSYLSFIALSAAVNLAVTALALGICRRLHTDRRLALAAGLLSAMWNTPLYYPYPWYESGAFLFLFLALWFLVAAGSARRPQALRFLAGVSVAVACHNKQTAGGAGMLSFTLYLLQVGEGAGALYFLLGAAAGGLGLLGLWAALGSASAVWRYLFLVPLLYGGKLSSLRGLAIAAPSAAAIFLAGQRFFARREWWLWAPLSGFMALGLVTWGYANNRLENMLFYPPLLLLAFMRDRRDRALLMSLVLLAAVARTYSFSYIFEFMGFVGVELLLFWKAIAAWSAENRQRLASWGVSSTEAAALAPAAMAGSFLFAVLFALRVGLGRRLSTTWEFPVATYLFAAAALAAGALIVWRGRSLKRTSAAVLCVLVGGLSVYRANASVLQKCGPTWNYYPETWTSIRSIPALRHVIIEPEIVVRLEGVFRHLQAQPAGRRPVFIYPNYTMIYTSLGQMPPQPFVWLHEGLTFRPGPPDEPLICGSLQSHHVGTIVLDGPNPPVFPCLARLLASDFVPDRDFGEFHVYARKGR